MRAAGGSGFEGQTGFACLKKAELQASEMSQARGVSGEGQKRREDAGFEKQVDDGSGDRKGCRNGWCCEVAR
jgi:hypothetical protein